MQKETASIKLFWVCIVLYAINIIQKMAFSATTAAMVSEQILTKTEAGVVNAAFWILYAIGQILGAILVQKVSPIRLLHIGFIGTSLANFAVGLAESYPAMLVIWALSGILQLGVWPSILSLVSLRILPQHRQKSMRNLSYCYCGGSIISYLLTTVFLSIASWRYVYFFTAAIGILPLVLLYYTKNTLFPLLEESVPVAKRERVRINTRMIFSTGLVFFFAVAFIKSILDNGIKMWMPTILTETYGVSPEYTSLLAVLLLGFNLFGVGIANLIYKKTNLNEGAAMLVLYLFIVPFSLYLLRFRALHIFTATALMTIMTVLLYGSGQLFSIYAPARFFRYAATIGGIVNAFAAAGNVVGSFGNGWIADAFGWDIMIIIWLILVFLLVLICLVLAPIWKKFMLADNAHLQ